MPTLERDGEVFLLRLDPDDNRFNPTWLTAVEAALDEVSRADGPRALVTVGSGKFFSNGLDLEWMAGAGDAAGDFVERVHRLLVQTLTLPCVTVAAVTGHVFAAGAMWMLAHDSAVMRVDRGFFCLPEVDLGLPFTPLMNALIARRLPPATAHSAMTTGMRFGGQQALAAGIVTEAVPEGHVVPAAVELAAGLTGKAGNTLATIKSRLYGDVLALLAAGA